MKVSYSLLRCGGLIMLWMAVILPAGAATHDVSMFDSFFSPSTLTIPSGDTVRWTQRGSIGHTTTSGNTPVPSGLWGSATLSLNQTFSFTFTSPGTFPYFCVPHALTMTGTITVQAVNTPPTATLTGPNNGASIPVPAHATLTANASDANGTVAFVQFFTGATSLGVDFVTPYEVSAVLPVGTHVLTAVATDNQGATGTSLSVTVVVPDPGPIHVTDIICGSGVAQVQWTGGVGPFALQGKPSLDQLDWANQTVTNTRTASVAMDGASHFYRVADSAQEPPLPLTLHMSGALERPAPVTTSGTGSGRFYLQGNQMTFAIQYAGLSGPATAAHIHGPATAAEQGGVLIDLSPFNGGSFGSSGRLSGMMTLTPEQKSLVMAGRTYVNVHTAINDSGEIRGQVAPVLMQCALSGAKERPDPVSEPGKGLGTFALVGNQLTFDLTYRGLTGPATAAHIHGPANASEPAGVLVDLVALNGGAFGASGSLSGTVTLTDDQLAYVVDGRTYLNLHTDAHGLGEIRGQLLPQSVGVPFTSFVSGAMERPTPLVNGATGSGTYSLEGDVLTFNIRYAGLSGPATAAHIHGAAPASQQGGIMIDLAPYNGGSFGSSGTLSGSVTLSAVQRQALVSGQTYFNVHTTLNGNGEARGQIFPVALRAILKGENERLTPVNSPGLGMAVGTLVRDRLGFNVSYGGLTGVATMAHIHGSATVFQAGGILVDLVSFNGGSFGQSGSLFGSTLLAPDRLAFMMDGLTYFNIHTPANSAGEIRGQIVK